MKKDISELVKENKEQRERYIENRAIKRIFANGKKIYRLDGFGK